MALGLCSYAADSQYFFNIAPKGGDVALSVAFANSPVLNYSFEASGVPTLVVSAEGIDDTAFVLDKEYSITYTTEETPTAVKAAVAEANAKMNNGVAMISGLKAGTSVCIFAANGAQVASAVADNSGIAVINLSAMPKGIVIIKAGDASFKLKK